MDAKFLLSARRKLMAGAIALFSLPATSIGLDRAWAIEQPAPSDTSTRKGVNASEKQTPPQENPLVGSMPIESEIDQQSKPKTTSSSHAKTVSQDRSDQQSNVSLAQWVSEWMKTPRRVTAKLAIHGVVPEIEFQAVIPAAQQKICANGKCYEVDEKSVESKACDIPPDQGQSQDEEQIIVAPVAPPVPPSFPFASQDAVQDSSVLELEFGSIPTDDAAYSQDVYGSLSNVQVTVPASMLIAYMVAHAQDSVRLEMTEQIAAERAMYTQRYELLLQHNQQLQTQLAVLEASQRTSEALATRGSDRRLASHTARDPEVGGDYQEQQRCQSLTASRDDWDAIQEDLSNIRRQIALLKKSGPIPFAASNIGTQESGLSRQPQALRTARLVPYTPVFPSSVKNPETSTK